jgi:hypothetical protein
LAERIIRDLLRPAKPARNRVPLAVLPLTN